MRLSLELDLRLSKKALVFSLGFIVVLVAIIAAAVLLHWRSSHSPIPKAIKDQLSFHAIYPNTSLTTDKTTFRYDPSNQIFTANTSQQGVNIVITEQRAPGNPQDNSYVYYQSLGLHPVAQINSKNGVAVLVNFYQTGNFRPEGQNGVLEKQGTLIIAHPQKDLSNEQWKSFFDNLIIAK